jgi:rhodanese-related sulfurtransferase
LSAQPRRLPAVVVLLILVIGLAPVLTYWFVIGRVPSITPQAAWNLLSAPDSTAILVDVRPPERYETGHIEAAQNWPLPAILAATPASMPAQFSGRRLVLICDSGITSALAARRLREISLDALNVRGGMQAWSGAAEAPCDLALCRLRAATGATQIAGLHETPVFEQWVAVLTAFGVKPTYMLATLAIILVLWRQRAPDLAALRWAMLAFLAGETCCLVNYVGFREESYLLEYLHSFGMVVAFGFTTYALLEGLNLRLVHYGDPQRACAAAALCRGCIKNAAVPCGLRRVFLLLIPATVVMSLIPFSGEFHLRTYSTRILGGVYTYIHPVLHQIYEVRFLPAIAAILFLFALGVLLRRERYPGPWSKMLFAAGTGALGFSYFRFGLLAAFHNCPVWFSAWEEITELLYVGTVAGMLWVFRRGLFGSGRLERNQVSQPDHIASPSQR